MTTATYTAAKCRNFINGQWEESRSGRTIERRNPAHLDEVVAVVPLSTRQEVRDAIAAAKAAFPAWRDTPAPARGRILWKAAELLRERKQEVARLLIREEGKALKDSLGEIERAINILEYMAGEGRRLEGETLPSELRGDFACTVKQPLGVVGAITQWNFPVAIPVWNAAPALVTGNTMVLKSAELTPLTAAAVMDTFSEAGLPAGVLNLVLGAGEEAGTNWSSIRMCAPFPLPGRTKSAARSMSSARER